MDSKDRLRRLKDEAGAFFSDEDTGDDSQAPMAEWWRWAWFCREVGRRFWRNRCAVRASALAYTTLLALVPMLAVAIGVSTSLLKTQSGEQQIQAMVDKFVSSIAPQLDLEVRTADGQGLTPGLDRSANRQKVAQQIIGYVQNVQSGTLGTSGVIGLILVAISLLSTIEATFNDIWGVSRGRSWISRVVNYWAAITLGPLVLLVVIGLMTGDKFEATKQWLSALPVVGRTLLSVGLTLLPYTVLSLAFGVFYLLMPNTKVQWSAALIGGVVGGCLWQLNNQFSVLYVSKVVAYSKIYGSFGLLPVFLVGMYFSWLILLLGAQVAFCFQHRHACEPGHPNLALSQPGREFAGMRMMAIIGEAYVRGESTPTEARLAEAVGVSPGLGREILQQLARSGLLLAGNGEEAGVALTRSPDRVNCDDILQALRLRSREEPSVGSEATLVDVRQAVNDIGLAERSAARAVTLLALVQGGGRKSDPDGKPPA
jgi:membrane protein